MITDHNGDNAEDDDDDDDFDNGENVGLQWLSEKGSPSPNQKGQILVPVNKTGQ